MQLTELLWLWDQEEKDDINIKILSFIQMKERFIPNSMKVGEPHQSIVVIFDIRSKSKGRRYAYEMIDIQYKYFIYISILNL